MRDQLKLRQARVERPGWVLEWREAARLDAREAAARLPRLSVLVRSFVLGAAAAVAASVFGAHAGARDGAAAVAAASLVAAVALSVPLPALAALTRFPGLFVAVAASASAAAAAIHFAVAPLHFGEYVPFGLLFLLTGAVQFAWALAVVLWPRPLVFAVGLVLSVGVVAVWVVTRTLGAPVGPDAGVAEPVGAADALCSVLELIVAAASALLLGGGRASAVSPAGRASSASARAVAVTTLVLLGVTAVALLSAVGVASSVIPPAG